MQRVLSSDLWTEIAELSKKAKRRQAAIAYVTQDLVEFQEDDVLIVNASVAAISSGGTDAKLLHSLQVRGIILYNCPDLHAKVILLDNKAIVGSGNMSLSSLTSLVEAAVLTDQTAIVAGIASFIEQLKHQSVKMSPTQIAELCDIKVVRRGAGFSLPKRRTMIEPLGNRTWLLGITEYANDPNEDEVQIFDQAASELEIPDNELDWLYWPSSSRFAKECREGDQLIQIWQPLGTKRLIACRAVPVLRKEFYQKWTVLYFAVPTNPRLPFGKFERLLKKLNYSKKVGSRTIHRIDPDMAEAIGKGWEAAAKL